MWRRSSSRPASTSACITATPERGLLISRRYTKLRGRLQPQPISTAKTSTSANKKAQPLLTEQEPRLKCVRLLVWTRGNLFTLLACLRKSDGDGLLAVCNLLAAAAALQLALVHLG